MQNTAGTDTTLTFQWSQYPCGERLGNNSYAYRLTADGTGDEVYSGTTAVNFTRIDNLMACRTYWFEVYVFNSAGDGPVSMQIEASTDVVGK